MKPPETSVDPGREQDAIREHARKMASRAALGRIQGIVGELEADELAKRRLIKYVVAGLIVLAAVIAAALLLAVL